MPLDRGEGDGCKCKHVRQPVWQFGVVVRQVPHVAIVIGKGRLYGGRGYGELGVNSRSSNC